MRAGELCRNISAIPPGWAAVRYILPLAALWLFIALGIQQKSAEQKRGSYALSTMFFLNLMIGATAIFSTKMAAPLWLLAGFLNSPLLTASQKKEAPDEHP